MPPLRTTWHDKPVFGNEAALQSKPTDINQQEINLAENKDKAIMLAGKVPKGQKITVTCLTLWTYVP